MEERVKRAIDKAEKLIKRAFPETDVELKVLNKAKSYLKDARYFFAMGDFVSAFGAADYAYGLVEAVYIMRGLPLPDDAL